MSENLKIAYWLRTDIQHFAHIRHIHDRLGGLILTKNPDIAAYIRERAPEKAGALILVRNSSAARKVLKQQGVKIVIYTGFQMLYYGYSVQVFHGASDKRYLEDRRVLQYDRLLLPGRKHWDKIRNAGYLKDEGRFRIVGYPKFDKLVNGTIEYTPLFDNGRPTILYAPTWISEGSGEDCSFSEFGESSLPLWGGRLVKHIGPRWNLIIKYHSRVNRNRKDVYDAIDAAIADTGAAGTVKTVWDADITPYMDQADLMISDISAVCYEWFHRNRPIVFANPAPEHYRPSDDPYSNTFAWQAGDVLYNEDDIIPVLERNLALDAHRELRNDLLRYSFFQPDGHATERQVNQIREFYAAVERYRPWQARLHNAGKMLRTALRF